MEILVVLLVVLVVARVFGEIAAFFGQPPLVGELVAGIAMGLVIARIWDASSLLEYYSLPQRPALARLTSDPAFVALTDLGIFFLMLHGGVELRSGDLARSSSRAMVIALFGVLVPALTGFGLAWIFLPSSDLLVAQCLFIGTALAITAVPVSIRVLMDLGKLDSIAGSIIVSAAIFDDILGLLLLAILTGVIENGQMPDIVGTAWLIGNILLFFVTTFLVGRIVFPKLCQYLDRFKSAEFEFTSLVVLALAFAVLAELLGLHFILGAFLAGLFFEKSVAGKRTYRDVRKKVSAITSGFLAPLFFASIGLHLDLSAVSQIPLFLFLLVIAAFLTKIIGAGLPAFFLGMSKQDSLAIGVGMSGRGAVELIIAGIALNAGLFTQPDPAPPIVANLFSAVVIVAIVTTIAVPPLLKLSFRDNAAQKMSTATQESQNQD